MPQPTSILNDLRDLSAWFDKKLPSVTSKEMIEADIKFLTDLLPKNYKVKANYKGDRLEGYYCTSTDGKGISDATEEWVPIFQAIKAFFKERFSEVFHTTCSDHLRFTIYLKH